MQMFRLFLIVFVGLAGCASPGGSTSAGSGVSAPSAKPAATPPVRRAKFTAENNPTTLAGRGAPSLEEADRPAAWVYINGKPGQYTEREGRRLIQWVIADPVGPSPTFRVEGFEPLLGDAREFKCVLRTVESPEGTEFMYGISASAGTFVTGKDYPLLNPGDNFVIRNGLTGDVVREIAPLAPGTYAIAAGLENSQTGKRAAAVTYFTVAEGK